MSTVKISQLPQLYTLNANTSNTMFVGLDITANATSKISAHSLAQGLYSYEILNVGTNQQNLPNTVAQFALSGNSYIQTNLVNTNDGGSADIVVTANVGSGGSDSTNFIDMGYANKNYQPGSEFNNIGTAIFPLDGYLYVQGTSGQPGGNLIIGTTTSGTKVNFIVGGGSSQNIVGYIDTTGIHSPSIDASISANVTPILGVDNAQNTNIIITGNYANAAYALANSSVQNTSNILLPGNVIINGSTTLNGNTYFNSNTIHNGDLVTHGNLITTGTMTTIGNVFTTGTLTANGTTTFNGNTIFNGPTVFVGDRNTTGNVINNGSSTYNGNVTINGPLVNNGLSINNGNTQLNGTVTTTGIVTIGGTLIPANNNISLGTANNPFNSLYISNSGVTFANANVTFSGALTVSGNSSFNGNTTTFTGNVTAIGTDGNNTFTITTGGYIGINTPMVPTGGPGALNIVGSYNNLYQPVTGTGGMVHITGNDNTLARVTVDGFLANTSGAQTYAGVAAGYGLLALRTARGNTAYPQPVIQGDVLASYSGLGWQGVRYSGGQVAGLQFYAAENFSVANTGTYLEVKVAPVGSNTGMSAMTVSGSNTTIYTTTNSSNTTSGSLVVLGGVGIVKDVYVGGNTSVTGNVTANNIVVGGLTISNNAIYSTLTASDMVIGQTGATANLVINRVTNHVKDINVTGNVVVSNVIQYTASVNNGTVTQLTSKSTGVTLNGRTGQITMNNASLAKGAAVSFTVTNNFIVSAKDVVVLSIASGATLNSYSLAVDAVTPGSFSICLTNNGSGALTDAPVINFAIIRVA